MLLTFEQVPSVRAKSSRATSLEEQNENNWGENTNLRFSVTISEAKTKVCWCPPSAGKSTFASLQLIPWSPSIFHNRLVVLPSLFAAKYDDENTNTHFAILTKT